MDKKDVDGLFDMMERIHKKIESSPVLNGAFDKMLYTVESIKEKQDIISEKVDKVYDTLYEPNEGFFSRVKEMEIMTSQFDEDHKQHIKSDEDNLNEINASLKQLHQENQDIRKSTEIAEKLKKIAGDDLDQLKIVVNRNKNFGKISWVIIAAVAAEVGKLIWEFISKH